MCLSVEVTKKNREDMTAPPREGSYVHGLFMEGKSSLLYLEMQSSCLEVQSSFSFDLIYSLSFALREVDKAYYPAWLL